MMPPEPPNLVYYRAVEGHWRCRFDFRITDHRALRRDVKRLRDRIQLRVLAALARFGLWMETSVDCTRVNSHREVIHTTRLAKWGITLIRTLEVILLDANGRDFVMEVSMRLGGGKCSGTVNEAGTMASYEIPFFGAVMRQTGHREGDVTRIMQETAFSRGEQRLRRVVETA